MYIGRLLELFIEYQMLKGNSAATVDYYKYCNYPFVIYCGYNYDINGLSMNMINRYILVLQKQHLSKQSIKSYVKGIKVFISWLYNESYITDNLATKIRLPKADKKMIDILSKQEIIDLMYYLDNKKSVNSIRNRLIIKLMLEGGLRKSEIVNIKIKDVKEQYILINGKGSKQRIIPLTTELNKDLRLYQKWLILNNYSNINDQFIVTKNIEPIKIGTIDRLFKTIRTETNIKRLYPHLLRHTFATYYLINGGQVNILKDLLGHTDLETTEIYIHLANSYKLRSANNFSPLSCL